MDKITIMIIDEQELFRMGIHQTLSQHSDFSVLECAPSQYTPQLIESTMPDIILLGCRFSVHDGLSLAEQIARNFPNSRVIVLTPDPDDEELFAVIKSSAVACITKSASVEELVNTIRKAQGGGYPINDIAITRPQVANRVLQEFEEIKINQDTNSSKTVYAPLTQREMQILRNISEGNTNKQIANILDISEQTIKNHISSILRKLNANDRAHAVTMAIRNNWISIELDPIK